MSSSSKVGRRRFLKYVGAGAVAATAAGFGYYATRPTSTQTATTQLSLPTPTADFDYKPRWINPTSADTIHFLNKSRNPDGTDTDLAYSWYVDDGMVANTKDYSTQLSADSVGTQHRVRLSTCRSGRCSDAESVVEVDPENDPNYPAQRFPDIRIKGVCYDAGTYYGPGADSTRRFITTERIENEILDIANKELGCNGLRIYGSDDDSILKCAEIAVRGDFDAIAISPRYVDYDMKTTILKTGELAKRCQALWDKHKSISFVIGSECTLVTKGFFEGSALVERNLNVGKEIQDASWHRPFQNFLGDLVAECRKSDFAGPLTYAAAFWERDIPWDRLGLSYVADDHYCYYWLAEGEYIENIRRLNRFNLPYCIAEFGSVTFDGAHDYGGGGWNEYEGKKYSQESQAESVRKYMSLFGRAIHSGAKIDACYWYNLTDANADECDIRSYALLKLNSKNGENRYSRKKAFYAYKSYKRMA